jgi:hypothetical protein
MTIVTLNRIDPEELIEDIRQGKYAEIPELPKAQLNGTSFKPRIYKNNPEEPIFTNRNRDNKLTILYSSNSKAFQAAQDGTLDQMKRICSICRCTYTGVGLPIPRYEEIYGEQVRYHGIGSYCYKGSCTEQGIRIMYHNDPQECQNYLDRFYSMWTQINPNIPIPSFNPDLLIECDGCLEYEEAVSRNYRKTDHIVIIPAKMTYRAI